MITSSLLVEMNSSDLNQKSEIPTISIEKNITRKDINSHSNIILPG